MNDTQEVSIKFNNTITNEKKVADYEKRLRNIYAYLNSIKTGQKLAFKDLDKNVEKVENATKGVNSEIDKVSKKANIAFNFKGIKESIKGIFNLGKNIKNLTDQYSAFIENINLLEVAYARQKEGLGDYNEQVKENSKQVKELINQMSKVYGLDESRLTRQFGIFKQLANAMKLPDDTAEQLSEHLVKMTNDIASLYNLDLNRASNALQSALAGQVRPIRSATGADITEKTLQNTVDALGLDRSISQLSYVEKRLVMVISLTEQLKKSQGDYGRTIESVSNQTRVLGEQWDRVKRSVGEMAYPLVKIILPYVNAILMVVAKIADLLANIIAKLLHVNLEEEFDYNNMAGISDVALDLEDNLFGAGEEADKLKDKLNGLRAFDKLNVISTPKDTTSSLGLGGIDPAILNAFNASFGDYNDELDKIQMKATKIADAIWEWLKGTDGSYTNLKFIGLILGTIVGFNLIKGIANIISLFKGLKTVVGVGKGASATGLLGSLSTLGTLLAVIATVWIATVAIKGIANAIKEAKEMKKAMEEADNVQEQNIQTVKEISNKYNELEKTVGVTDEQTKLYIATLETQRKDILDEIIIMEKQKNGIAGILGINKKHREEQEKLIGVLDDTTDKYRTLYEQGKLDEEGTKKFTKSLEDQIIAMDLLGQDTSNLKTEYEKLTGRKWQAVVTGVLKDEVTGPFEKLWKNITNKIFGVDWGFDFKGFGGSTGGGGRADGGIFANGQWHDITAYAGGGLPPIGQMFVARENGPELVGKIGSHTAVMNNDQIVGSVSDGVYRAMINANRGQSQGTQVYNIYLDESHKLGTYTLEQLQDMAKTNGKPITITG